MIDFSPSFTFVASLFTLSWKLNLSRRNTYIQYIKKSEKHSKISFQSSKTMLIDFIIRTNKLNELFRKISLIILSLLIPI